MQKMCQSQQFVTWDVTWDADFSVTWKIKVRFADVTMTFCHMGSKLLSTHLKLSRETN